MSRHFELQVQERGERRGCLTFRKVARWYCKVLKPGRELHRRLMMINSCAEFESILRSLRERPDYHDGRSCELDRDLLATPTGPNERW